jgi:hypothetical protein
MPSPNCNHSSSHSKTLKLAVLTRILQSFKESIAFWVPPNPLRYRFFLMDSFKKIDGRKSAYEKDDNVTMAVVAPLNLFE